MVEELSLTLSPKDYMRFGSRGAHDRFANPAKILAPAYFCFWPLAFSQEDLEPDRCPWYVSVGSWVYISLWGVASWGDILWLAWQAGLGFSVISSLWLTSRNGLSLQIAEVPWCLYRANWAKFAAEQQKIQPSEQESEEKYGKGRECLELRRNREEAATRKILRYPLLGTGLWSSSWVFTAQSVHLH